MLSRQFLEEQERQMLASYAMASANSKGRATPEDEHPYRTAYQRDRDRVIHTTAFRRLEYKTQVFIITEGDYYRTRLTHSVEVAQIGRTIARALRANEDLTEAICLAHDLGHGPFGHSGEEALNKLMANHGGFDHNHQGLRIIEELEQRFPDFNGLNLTWEVREGMLKHESEYDKGMAFAYDPHLRGTLEAQIVNLSDEIAYTTADLDDGLRSGMITPAQLTQDSELWRLVTDELGINGKTIISDMDRHRIVRRLVGKEVTSVIEATYRALNKNNIQSVDDVRNMPHNLVSHRDDFIEMHQELKRFLYKNLYSHWRVMRMANKANRLIAELFNAFIEDPSMLPTQTQEKLNGDNLYRIVCDYVAGMTDRFAIKEHKRLFDPAASV
jgi:dGTPase